MSSTRSLWSRYQRRLRRRKLGLRKGGTGGGRRSGLRLEAIEPRMMLTATAFDLNLSGSSVHQPPESVDFVTVGDVAFFVADNGENGRELWVTDGREDGTRQVLDIKTGADGSNPGLLTEFNGELYFVADDGVHGEELWKSDGTESGTQMVRDINPGEGYQYPYGDGPLQSFPRDLIEFNGMLLFSAEDAVNGAELWRTDGTAEGTMMVTDIYQGTFTDSMGTYPNSSNPAELAEFNGNVYFSADDGETGRELWKTDGTAEGTMRVSDLYTGEYHYIRDGFDYGVYPNSSSPSQLTESGGSLFFVARDQLTLGNEAADDVSNFELWKTDGTAAGTVKVREIDPSDVGGLTATTQLFDVNGILVFAADDGSRGNELWRSDGTEENTLLVREFTPGEQGNLSSVAFFAKHEDWLYFTANDEDAGLGHELWRTNGTARGTTMVRDIFEGIDDGFPVFTQSVGDYIYFAATDGVTGFDLWRSDGTESGTVLVEDLLPGADSATPSNFSMVGETLIFAADDGSNGREVWVRSEDARDATASLNIFVDSEEVAVPGNVGVDGDGNAADISTDGNGRLAWNTGNLATLDQFFNTWRTDAGVVGNNSSATFSSTELMGNAADADNTVQMFVNGTVVRQFEQYRVQPDDEIVLVFGDNPVVSLQTNFGPIVVELFEDDAPGTVDNFLNYVNDGDYDSSFFHRSVDDFVIQGGGFSTTSPTLIDLRQLTEIPTDDPIVNEFKRSNTRGTIAMAKLGGDPDSATSQFFVNLTDNVSLDTNNGGFTVFGQVLDMTSVEAIATLPIIDVADQPFNEVPLSPADVLPTIANVAGNGSILGRQFRDRNANQTYDSGEEIVGAIVFADVDADGILDADEPRAVTDSTGQYRLQAEAGTYLVRSVDVTTTLPQSVAVATGREVDGIDFIAVVDLVAPTGLDLIDASDLGSSNTDNLTSLNNADANSVLQFSVTGVVDGAEVRIYSDGVLVGSGLAFGTTVTVATDGVVTLSNGTHAFTATVGSTTDSMESAPSPALTVEVSYRMLGEFTTAPPTMARVGEAFSLDVESGDEGTVSYSLVNGPDGMVIDADSGLLTWTPGQNQAAPVEFDIVASDAAGNSISQSASMTVLGVVGAMDDSYSAIEDSVLTVDAAAGVLSNDAANGIALNAALVSEPSNGQVTLNADGSFSYAPNQDFNGTDAFSYRASDGTDDSNVATVTITVSPVADAPVGVDDSYTVDEDTTLVVTAADSLLSNDTDADGDPLTASVVTEPDSGQLTLMSNGTLNFTPAANFNGTVTFQYAVSDGTSSSGPVDVTIEVAAVNDAPTGVSDVYTVAEDASLTVSVAEGVLANDADVDGDTLVATLSQQPSNGVVGLNSDGSFTYTPSSDFFGTDSFTYVVSDGVADASATTVSIEVTSAADSPVANDDTFTVANDGTEHELDVLANDTSEPDGTQTLVITAVTQGANGGTVSFDSAGLKLNYRPATGFSGSETFSYTIQDADGLTNAANVTVNVQEDAPVGDSEVTGFVYLDADMDGERDSGEFGLPGSLITLAGMDEDGNSVSETALTSDTGYYTFEELRPGTYSLTQTQPAATLDGMTTVDLDGAVVGSNEISNIVISGDETVIENNFGEETLRPEIITISWFFASSASNGSDAEQLREIVAAAEERAGNDDLAASIRAGSTEGPTNTPPVAVTDSYTVLENGTLDVSVVDGVLENDTDLNGDTLTAVLGDTTTNGALIFNPDGSFTYEPNTDFSGIDSFTYFANDGDATSNNALVTIVVDSEAPIQTADNEFTISENTPNGTVIGTVTPSASLAADRVYEIVDSTAPSELALVTDDHMSGESDAQLVLIEYLDLQCPTCAQMHAILEDLKDQYDTELLVVSRHLPLESIHPNARLAAQNAEAAGRQGEFDGMVDLMFENQADWAGVSDPQSIFDGYANDLGLDMTQFASDRVDAAIDAGIQADLDSAAALNATSTPTLYLDGRELNLSDALTDFSGIIDDALDDFDAAFVVDRASGEIIVSPVASFNASSTPVREFDVRTTDSTGTSISDTVKVTVAAPPQAALSAVDAAFAEI